MEEPAIKKSVETLLKEIGSMKDEQLISCILLPNNPHIRLFQEEIYNRYIKIIYGKCILMIRDQNIANDLVHDIFILVFTKLHTYRGDSPFFGWVNSIAHHKCISYLKKKKVFNDIQDYEISNDYDAEKEIKISHDQNLELLEQAFDAMPKDKRIIMVLKYHEQKSISEIAGMLEIGESAVKMRLARGRSYLLGIIENQKNKT